MFYFLDSYTDYYAACDLVVVPFLVPHFSRGAIEAGFMGKPVVASKIEVMSEVVDDYHNGLLARQGDASDLVEKIKMFMDDPQLGKKLGETGLRRSQRDYDAEKYAFRLMAIYDKVCP